MSTLIQPEPAVATQRVCCQSEQAAAILEQRRDRWEILPVPVPFPRQEEACVIVADSSGTFTADLREAIQQDRARLIYVLRGESAVPPDASGIPVFSFIASPVQAVILEGGIQAAFDNLQLARSQATLQRQLKRARTEIDELNAIGIALSSARDTAALLNLILRKSREITSSDAGSLYLVEETESGEKQLRFKLTQNDSLEIPFAEFVMPINALSIAGYVALTGEELHLEDAYHTPPELPFRFNRHFDQESGYRTKSMLVVAMKNPQAEIIGVVQLINCKRDAKLRIDTKNVDSVVVPYDDGGRALVSSLASQAAVAIENNRLYESIQTLFEGFVKASVVAIEARDPTTSGHSFRVADLTVALAEAVDRCNVSPFGELSFSRAEMKEIRYASLLHDFGKVGVKEEVLVKAKKLYPMQLDIIKQRFDFVRKAIQQEHSERKLTYLLERGREDFLARQEELDRDYRVRIAELDDFFKFVLQCNEPTVLPEGDFRRLADLAGRQFFDWEGASQAMITFDETRLLSIPKGSLNDEERSQIESHVIHTFNFLSQIPWTKEIRNIPIIARAHHEKLNGTGYPYKLTEAEIPFQAKMMTVSDIYDALSASDRPYKKAVPTDRALDILRMEANQRLIDNNLLQLFVEAEVYKKTFGWKHPAA